MKLTELKAELGLTSIPFNKPSTEHPKWRSFHDTNKGMMFVIPTDLFDTLVKDAANTQLYYAKTDEIAKVSKRPYVKVRIGIQQDVDFL